MFLVLGRPRQEDPGASWPATLADLGNSKRGKDSVSKNSGFPPFLHTHMTLACMCLHIVEGHTRGDGWEEKRGTTDHRKGGHEAAERSRDSNAFPHVSASVCHLSSHFLQEKSFSFLSVRISRKTQTILH